MIKTFFKVFFKVLLAIGGVFVIVTVLRQLSDEHSDYIEIYNDQDEFDEEYY